jgi:phage-related minor tail protein
VPLGGVEAAQATGEHGQEARRPAARGEVGDHHDPALERDEELVKRAGALAVVEEDGRLGEAGQSLKSETVARDRREARGSDVLNGIASALGAAEVAVELRERCPPGQ